MTFYRILLDIFLKFDVSVKKFYKNRIWLLPCNGFKTMWNYMYDHLFFHWLDLLTSKGELFTTTCRLLVVLLYLSYEKQWELNFFLFNLYMKIYQWVKKKKMRMFIWLELFCNSVVWMKPNGMCENLHGLCWMASLFRVIVYCVCHCLFYWGAELWYYLKYIKWKIVLINNVAIVKVFQLVKEAEYGILKLFFVFK